MSPSGVQLAVPVLIIGLLAFGFAAVIGRTSGFYRTLVDQEVASKRYHAIDGLRGYLALSVLFHHLTINYQYYQTGVWQITSSGVNTFLGRGAVAFFFMITAFLFWNRAMDAQGQPNVFSFYVSRLRRTLPMYLVSACLLIATAFTLTRFHLLVRPLDLTRQIAAWILFTIPGTPDINGLNSTTLINTVFWSLAYEWKFYLLFPFLAIFATPRTQWWLAVATAICIRLFSDTHLEWFFFAGAMAAMLTRVDMVRKVARSWFGTVVAVACIGAAIQWRPETYIGSGAELLFLPFVVFASGNSMLGLLTCRPARLLGLVSYSLYLLHSWVLFVVSRLFDQYVNPGTLSQAAYWLLGAAVALVTVALAAGSYRFIEHPYIRTAKRSEPENSEPREMTKVCS